MQNAPIRIHARIGCRARQTAQVILHQERRRQAATHPWTL